MSIFVGNLPFRAEQEDVAELFMPFGEVTTCSLPLERDTGRKRGFAFVEMADEAMEAKAIEALQGAELMGRPLRINKAEPRTGGGGGGGGPRSGGGGYQRGGGGGSYGGSGSRGWEDRSYGSSGRAAGGGAESVDSGRARRRRSGSDGYGGGAGGGGGGDYYGGAEG